MKWTLVVLLLLMAALGWPLWRDSKRSFYFGYGANTNTEYFLKRVPSASLCGRALLPEFEFRWNNYGNIVPKSGSQVEGVLWSILKTDFDTLDTIEENYFRRSERVFFHGRFVHAQIYFMNDVNKKLKPGEKERLKDYVDLVRQGYKENGLSLEQLDH
jgi:hypothetical protein